MKNHLEKENVEFRYYEIPQGMPVLPLLGEKWITRYGADPMHFHNYLELGYCYSGKVSCILEINLYRIGREPLL